MPIPAPSERKEVDLRSLQQEIELMRAEQREIAAALRELVTSFRMIATHLGIASEPYLRKTESTRGRDVEGFG